MATAEKAIWFQSSREQLDALLLEACEGLQLRLSRHELAVVRYGTVNELPRKSRKPFPLPSPSDFPARLDGAGHHVQTSRGSSRS
jgi:hypothetical protein